MKKRSAIWITWERHRRTRELCESLGVELVELTCRLKSPLKYPYLLLKTVAALLRSRPRVLFVQCPSILLGVTVAALRCVFRYTLVADLHNEAVEPINSSTRLYHGAFALIRRAADVSIVSNDALKVIVDSTGGRGFVLPDRIPALPSAPSLSPRRDSGESARVVFICTYAIDEPVVEMIEAARMVGPRMRMYVTGNRARFKGSVEVPAHVELTGFLSEAAYEQLLREADVVVDLTSLENCLVCGAYEAVALEKPLITSDTRALRQYFRLGAVYSTHEPRHLAESIRTALARRSELAAQMTELKRELTGAWARRRDELVMQLGLE